MPFVLEDYGVKEKKLILEDYPTEEEKPSFILEDYEEEPAIQPVTKPPASYMSFAPEQPPTEPLDHDYIRKLFTTPDVEPVLPPKGGYDLPYQKLMPEEMRKPFPGVPYHRRMPPAAQAVVGYATGIPILGHQIEKLFPEPVTRIGRLFRVGGRGAGFINSAIALGPLATRVIVTDAIVSTPGGAKEKLTAGLLNYAILKIFNVVGRLGNKILQEFGTTSVKRSLIQTGEAASGTGLLFGIMKLFGAPTDEALTEASVMYLGGRGLTRVLGKFGRPLPKEVAEEAAKEIGDAIVNQRAINLHRLMTRIRRTKTVEEVLEELPERPPIEKPAAKQPWEMTRKEYARTIRPVAISKIGKKPIELPPDHHLIIKRALDEGKPVPPEILAEYPDLKPAVPEQISRDVETAGGSEEINARLQALEGKVLWKNKQKFRKGADPELIKEYKTLLARAEAAEPKPVETVGDTIASGDNLPLKGESPNPGRRRGRKPPDKKLEEMSPEELDAAAEEVRSVLLRSDIEADVRYSMTIRKLIAFIRRKWFNPSANFESYVNKENPVFGKFVSERIALARGATPWSKVAVEDAYPEVWGKLSSRSRQHLNWVVRARDSISIKPRLTKAQKTKMRTLDKMRSRGEIGEEEYTRKLAEIKPKEIIHPEGLTREYFRAFMANRGGKDRLSESEWKEVNKSADEIFKGTRRVLDEMRDRGTISEEDHARMIAMRGEYLTREFIDKYIDPEYQVDFSERPIRVSGMPKMEEGARGALMNDSLYLYEQYLQRAYRRMENNDVLNALWEFGWIEGRKAKPPNRLKTSFVLIPKPGMKKPTGFSELKFRSNLPATRGKPRRLWIKQEMAKELVFREPGIAHSVVNIVNIATGNFILKRFATGINWAFAATNPFRDLQYIFVRTNEYSPLAPVAAKQMLEDFRIVWHDGVKQSGAWYDIYGKYGGLMDWMTRIGMHRIRRLKPTKHYQQYEGKMKFLRELGSWPGDVSELTPRLMLMRRGILNRTAAFKKKYGREPNLRQLERIYRSAVAIARSYLDFAVAGQWSKAIDLLFPYFNPRVQGIRGTARAIVEDPLTTLPKIAELIAIRAGFTIANILINPEAWLDTSDHDKASNWIFNTPFKFKDRRGAIISYLLKFPMSPDHRVIGAISDAIVHTTLGLPVNKRQLADAAQDWVVFFPESWGPAFGVALATYITNTNLWRRQPIWKGEKVDPHLERKIGITHPWVIKATEVIAERTGIEISPDRFTYAASQVFPLSNFFLDFLGKTTKAFSEWPGIPETERETYLKEIMGRLPGAGRFLDATVPQQRLYKEREPIIREEVSLRKEQRDELDKLIIKYRSDLSQASRDRIIDHIVSQPVLDQDRLRQHAMRRTKFFGVEPPLQSITWWQGLLRADTPVPARARLFYNEWIKRNKTEREAMQRFAGEIGLATDDFIARFSQLE